MYFLALVALASTATLTAARVLPRSGGFHTPLKLSAPLQVRYYEEEKTPHENTPFRKNRNRHTIVLRNLNYPKLPEHLLLSDFPKQTFLPKLSKYPKNKRLRSQSQYGSMFNQDGMLFLTNKKDTEDRKLNTFLNKVVKYEMGDRKHKYLRKPITAVFKKDELDRLQTIVDSMKGNDDSTTMPKMVYDFNNLVI